MRDNIMQVLSSLNKILHKEYHRLDLWYFISFISGIIFYFKINIELSWLSLILVISILLIIYLNTTKFVIKFFVSIGIFFAFSCLVCKFNTFNLVTIPIFQDGIKANVTGRVTSIKNTNRGIEVVVNVIIINPKIKLKKIRISFASKFNNSIDVGDKINFRATLYNISKNILPESYDFALFSYLSEIHASGYAMNQARIVSKKQNINSFINNIRQTIYNRLITRGGKNVGNFTAAFLIGETKSIDKTLITNVRNAGISHILCISGLHLSLVGMLIFTTSRFLLNLSNFIAYNFNIKIISAILSLIGSYFYLLISGNQIAATRAFVMSALFILSIMIKRKVAPLRALGIGAIIILFRHPEYVFHPSFQLSFSAVLSLIVGFEFYQSNKFFKKSTGLIGQIKFYFISNVYSSILASIITAPIMFSHFYTFPTYTLLNNLIAVPLMSFFLMPLGLLTIFLMPFNIDYITIKLLGWFINLLIKFVNYSNNLPSPIYYTGNISSINLAIFIFGFFWLCIWQSKIRILGIIMMLVSLLLMKHKNNPDFIFDYSIFALGVKSENNELKIYSNNLSHFKLKFWANWYGQKTATISPINESFFINNDNKTLSINYNENDECKKADIQINLNKTCPADLLEINNSLLETIQLVTIYCNSSKCHIRFNTNRFYSP